MSKPTTTFYIRQVADAVGVSAAVIRSWEQEGLLSPTRAPNGYRLYSPQDLERARKIRDLTRVNGLNAAGVRQVLGPEPTSPERAGAAGGVRDDIGPRVRRRREDLHLSLRALAARSGVAASHISALERSRTKPSVATVGKLADALGTTFLALIGSDTIGASGVVRAAERLQPAVAFSGS